MDILIKALQLILSLSLLVMVHEFGHFIFAKIFGVRVEKFYLFFNPKFSLFKFKIGETEYGMGWVPFGGYVKLSGMIDESMDKEAMKQPPKEYEFRSKPAWQRLLIMIGGVLMNIITAFIIYIGLSFYYGDQYIKNSDVKYGYAFTELAQSIGFENGDKIISVDGKQYDDFRKVLEAVIISSPKTVEVDRNGEMVVIPMKKDNIEALLNDRFFTIRNTYTVDSLSVDGGALKGGIMVGDSLVGVNGRTLVFADEYKPYFDENKGKTVIINVLRDSAGTRVPRAIPVEVSEEGLIGIFSNPLKGINVTQVRYNFPQAVGRGVTKTVEMVSSYIDQLKLVFSPKTGAYKQLGSVISIGNIFPSTWDWPNFWSMTAFLSVILAVMNLLPIPALDGGHVIILLYEVITRRKPSDKVLEVLQVIGMILLIALMVFALGNDVYRHILKR